MVKYFPLRFYYKKYFSNNNGQNLDLQSFNKDITLIKRILRSVPWKITCLMESLIIKNYLFRYGIVLPIVVGIRINDKLEAHAWYDLNKKYEFQRIL